MTRTPGQIAYEAAKPLMAGSPIDWKNPRFDPDAKEKWEAAASAVIEMCAKVAEEHGATSEMEIRYLRQKKGPEWHAHLRAKQIAAALRALKDAPHG